MLETIKTDIKALFLEREDCDAGTVQQLRNGLAQAPTQYKALRDAVDAMKSKLPTVATAQQKKWHLKLGIASYFLGRMKEAAGYLKQADGALANFYVGRAQTSLHELDDAMKSFDRAEKSGYTTSQVQLQGVNVLRLQNHLKESKTILGKLSELGSHSGEYHYQLGSILLSEGDRPEAIKHYERAVELDPNQTGALFQLGYANDLAGNDEEAIGYYERSVEHLPAHLGALMNLGILYEDTNQYTKATQCYSRILSVEPTNDRARLFLKDSQASETMYYDEEAERKDAKFSQILEVPVTDFELSVRSRNCLKKMNIRSLGDLTRVTEPQLLASKNFGETSLLEIKEMMTSKGLRLGQAMEEGAKYDPRFRPAQPLSEQEQAVLNKPVSELNLSVRARKCMNKLSIMTLGELIQRTPDELLEIKNFGQTSLLEVREKLQQYGLKLRGDWRYASFPGSAWERTAARLRLASPADELSPRGRASGAARSQAEPGNEVEMAAIAFELLITDGRARRGRLQTPHGVVETPVFMPVGTQATVKGLTPAQLEELGAEIILGNTYHLALRPGSELIAEQGGLHRFMNWQRPILTDSGGYQVYSLAQTRKITDEAAVFRSHIDGAELVLTPERAIEIQEQLGSDIAMCLDECPPSVGRIGDPSYKLCEAVRRTIHWAERCKEAHRREDQALFGIVQGATDLRLREECAQALVALDFPGYALGGFSVGEDPAEMIGVLEQAAAMLPERKPRYLMGVGRPQDVLEAVARGIDMFDCVLPTRNGRNAQAFTATGTLRLRNACHRRDSIPLESDCSCYTCRHFSRAYLHHLFNVEEMLGPTLLSLHNIAYYLRLMAEMRQAIAAGRFAEFRSVSLARWGTNT